MADTRDLTLRVLLVLLFGQVSVGGVADSVAAEGLHGWKEGPNVLGNGDFSQWDSYQGRGVTTTSIGVPPDSIPKHWYGGPGVGATATYDVAAFAPGQREVPGNPKRHLQIRWATSASRDWPGETHHVPAFRCTILENFSMTDVRRFAGQPMLVRFSARVGSGSIHLIPILWHSYDSQTSGVAAVKGKGYELFESSGEVGVAAVAQGKPRPQAICEVTTDWRRFERVITLPGLEGQKLTPDNYTGVGFDFDDRYCPVLDLAQVDVRPLVRAGAK
jgi:hypothetical protein